LQADLMATVSNGLGGSVQVSYAPATSFPSNSVPKQVVTSAISNDGRSGVSATTYSYSGGVYSRRERRFLGFRQVRQTLPCGAGRASVPTWTPG